MIENFFFFKIESVFLLLWQLNVQDKCLFFKNKTKKKLILVWLCQHWPLEFLNGGEKKHLSSISFSYIFY